jgi:hypothetical protein
VRNRLEEQLTAHLHEARIKQFYYRPWQALRVPGGWSSQILRKSAHERGKVVRPTHRPSYPQDIFLVLIYVRSWVDPRATIRPEGLCQWKIPITPSGIDPATFQFVVQCLNHCATACKVRTLILTLELQWGVAINYEWLKSDCTVLLLRFLLKNTAESTKFNMQSKSILILIKYFIRVLHTMRVISKQGSSSKEKIINTRIVLKKNTFIHSTKNVWFYIHDWNFSNPVKMICVW